MVLGETEPKMSSISPFFDHRRYSTGSQGELETVDGSESNGGPISGQHRVRCTTQGPSVQGVYTMLIPNGYKPRTWP
jgi:hypothetical protein